MNIAIIGTGGVGGYFGGKLAQAGHNVTFIARGKHLEAMQNKGLEVKSILGDFRVDKVTATDNMAELENINLVLVAVKAWQVKDVAKAIKPALAEKASVIPLQNGILAMEELQEVLGKGPVVAGLCRIISKIEAPGVINHLSYPPTIVLGEEDNSRTQRVEEIKEVLETAGIKAIIADDIQKEIWKKFIAICVSGLLAVTRATYGEVREIPETRKMMQELFNEIYQLSQKLSINISPDFIDKTMSFIDTLSYDSTASLTRDIWEGKPSELEYQNGTVVKLGEKWGIETPINRFVYYALLPSEQKARNKAL